MRGPPLIGMPFPAMALHDPPYVRSPLVLRRTLEPSRCGIVRVTPRAACSRVRRHVPVQVVAFASKPAVRLLLEHKRHLLPLLVERDLGPGLPPGLHVDGHDATPDAELPPAPSEDLLERALERLLDRLRRAPRRTPEPAAHPPKGVKPATTHALREEAVPNAAAAAATAAEELLEDAAHPGRHAAAAAAGPAVPARGTRRVRLVRGEGRGVSD